MNDERIEPRFDLSRVAFWFVVAVAAAWRVHDLNLKPLHSDEAVNGWFMSRLIADFHYHYRPNNYHGPLLYFANYLPMKIAGANELTLRLPTAIAGVGAVASMSFFRAWIGRWGVVAAAALLAVSAPDVYFSRTCIHETWLVLFTLLGTGALLHAMRTGEARYFIGCMLAWAAAMATKETIVLSLPAVLFGVGLTFLPGFKDSPAAPLNRVPLRRIPGWLKERRLELAIGVGLSLLVLVVLFTSFFTYPFGIVAMFQAFFPWLEYGVSGRNQGKAPGYFLGMWAWWAPVIMVAVPALILGLSRRSRFTLLCLGWFVSSVAVYEFIPYKTPWCAIQIWIPAFLMAGHGVQLALDWKRPALRLVGVVLVLAFLGPALAEGWRQTYDANLVRPTAPQIPYVYVQTRMPFMRLPADLWAFRESRKNDEGATTETRLFGVECKNPLRWYLVTRGWPKRWVGFRNKWPDDAKTEERVQKNIQEAPLVVVARKWEKKTLEVINRDEYERRTYQGRAGHNYVMFVRKELAHHLPKADLPLLDGGGDPLKKYEKADPSPLPFVEDELKAKPLRRRKGFKPVRATPKKD